MSTGAGKDDGSCRKEKRVGPAQALGPSAARSSIAATSQAGMRSMLIPLSTSSQSSAAPPQLLAEHSEQQHLPLLPDHFVKKMSHSTNKMLKGKHGSDDLG